MNRGFTLIELLVVVAIISMLVGIIAPGLRGVVRQARNLKQKSVMKSMETGLELYAKDFDGYPDSSVLSNSGAPPYICGAQRMTEALVGRDGRGFDPKTKWYAPDPVPDYPDLYTDEDKSLNRRKNPYVELKDTGAYLIFPDLYDTDPGTVFSSNDNGRAPVFADIYRHRRVDLGGGQSTWAGNPIVYFKADASSRYFGPDSPEQDKRKWIYNYEDNREIFKLGPVQDPINEEHHYNPTYTDTDKNMTGEELFYEDITDHKVKTGQFVKPYNANTFILMSAGWDGIFGTKDDITNFNY